MNKLIILSGIPGAGKTTYAQKLYTQKKVAKVVSNDDLRFQLTDGKFLCQSTWNRLPILRKQYQALITNLDSNSIVILDSTMLTNKKREKYYNKFKKYFDIIELHIISPDLEKSIRQNQMRDKVVPVKQIIKMYKEFEFPNETIKQLYTIHYIN